MMDKQNKREPTYEEKKKRVRFAWSHKDKDATAWKRHLQGVGDIKEFTWYPRWMRPSFARLRCKRTIMSKKERKKGPFQRPKKWYPRKHWQHVRKQKLFALTTSNGQVLTILIPKPYNKHVWAGLVNTKLAPFLKRAFPEKRSFMILLDGEKVFRAPVAKAAMAAHGISLIRGYPPNSAELNPQENVWPIAEKTLRKLERKNSTFEAFGKNIQEAVKLYPSPEKLVGGMAKRCQACIKRHGDFLDW